MKVFSLYIISMMRYYKMVLMFNLYLVRPKATSALYGEEDLNLLLQQCSCHPLNHLSCIPESLLEHHIPITGTNILVSSSSLDTKSGTLLRTAISNCCDCRMLRDIVLSCFFCFSLLQIAGRIRFGIVLREDVRVVEAAMPGLLYLH